MSMPDHLNRLTIDKVLNFGGSSVGTPERIKSVIEIISKAHDHSSQIAVVVSAFGGVTDQLIALGKMAANGKDDYSTLLAEVIERHKVSANTLIPQNRLPHALKAIDQTLSELCNVLEGLSLIKELSPKTLDLMMSFGERLSAFIISEAVGHEHPFYHLSGSDNIIAITSDFYQENPLVIKGQGAGAKVTAGKVFADIVRIGLDPLS